jgi:hypothetical protein
MRPRNPNPKGPQGHPGAESRAKVPGFAEWEGDFRFEGTRGPPMGGLTVHAAQAAEAVASQRREAPARAGAGWGEDDLGRGQKTQGRSESRSGRKARRGFGTRRRSKASRPSKSRRTSRERELATAHGAGEVENAPLPGRDFRASGSEDQGFALVRAGRRWCRKTAEPSLFGGRSTRLGRLAVRTGAQASRLKGDGGCGGPGNRPEHPHSRRDAVAGLPNRQEWRLRCEARNDGCASGGSEWTLGPRGEEVCASGRNPWHGVVRTRADPARLHGGATARGQRAAGTRYRLPMRTDSEGKFALRGGSWFTRTARRAIGEQRG